MLLVLLVDATEDESESEEESDPSSESEDEDDDDEDDSGDLPGGFDSTGGVLFTVVIFSSSWPRDGLGLLMRCGTGRFLRFGGSCHSPAGVVVAFDPTPSLPLTHRE